MPDMKPSSFQAEVNRMANDDARFDAFMKRRWEDGETGGQGGDCDKTCKRFQLCNLAYGSSLAEFLSCIYDGYNKMVQKNDHNDIVLKFNM